MYLSKVYRDWKFLFWLIITGMVLQAYSMYKGIENVPFFLHNMFSTTHAAADSVKVYLVKTNAGYFNTSNLSGRENEMLMNNVAYYHDRSRNRFRDPLIPTVESRFKDRVGDSTYQYLRGSLSNSIRSFEKFPAWWGRYFMQVQARSFPEITLVSTFIYFQPSIYKSSVDEIVFSVQESR